LEKIAILTQLTAIEGKKTMPLVFKKNTFAKKVTLTLAPVLSLIRGKARTAAGKTYF
jgi:hypothetical protein